MRHIPNMFSQIGVFLHYVFSLLLSKILSSRTKRIMFISSLYAYIKQIQNPDEEIALKLNQVMCLSSREDALMLPMALSKYIWRNGASIHCSTEEVQMNQLSDALRRVDSLAQQRIISEQVIQNTPQWLQYGSHRRMRYDLMELFKNIKVA